MVPHRHVAEVRLGILAEPQLEGERVLPVVGRRRVVGAGRQRRFNDCRRHRARCGAGELLVVAGVVGEGDPHLDGLARIGGNKGVGGSGCPVDLSGGGEPLVGEGSVVEAVVVGYAGGAGGEGLAHLDGAGDGGQPGGRGVGR